MLPAVWLVLLTLADPTVKPEPVKGFSDMDACVIEAQADNQQGELPRRRDRPPKGKAFVCMAVIYPN